LFSEKKMASSERANPENGAVTAAKLAELLTGAGRARVTAADVKADLAEGAPSLPGGKIPLLAYIRWLHIQVVTGAA
jgi:hypothetical protein